MALLRRKSIAVFLRSAGAGLDARPGLVTLIALLSLVSISAGGQISDGAGKLSSTTAFLNIGGENTQFPFYADNALGFDTGLSYQPHDLMGFEARIGAYPYSARFVQVPITAGYRVSTNSIFGFPYAPFVYIGGGVSRSQDEGLGKIRTSPNFEPCWQVDVGFDRTYASFGWRIAQISWRETYGPQQTFRSLGLSTGIIYRLRR